MSSFTLGLSLRGYLGLSYVNNEGQIIPITEEEFAAFIPVIAAAFPDGFTIYDATGGYYDPVLAKTVTERTKVLEVIAPRCGSAGATAIKTFGKVMDQYTATFHQSGQFWTKSRCEFVAK